MATVLGGCDHETDFSDFKAVTVKRSGSFSLDMSPDHAFPLFTAPGEELWVPGWKPFILTGDGYQEGTVWVTSGQGHTAYWYVAAYDSNERHAKYVRVTPGANTGTVDVRVEPHGNTGAKVNVTYQLTGLTEAGNKNIEETLDEAAYLDMMAHWRDLINDSVATMNDHL